MTAFAGRVSVSMDRGVDIQNITPEVAAIVQQSGVATGIVAVAVTGSTGSVTTIEFEPGAVEDLARAIQKLAPEGAAYAHEEAWHDGNGHSHVQAALMGPSVTLPVRQGKPMLGTWQQIVLVNHDNRPRTRKAEVTVLGE